MLNYNLSFWNFIELRPFLLGILIVDKVRNINVSRTRENMKGTQRNKEERKRSKTQNSLSNYVIFYFLTRHLFIEKHVSFQNIFVRVILYKIFCTISLTMLKIVLL